MSTRDDRAVGAILGMAAGDALGAGYEFGPPLPDDAVVEMRGGGTFQWAPGEWTDDTSMAVPILRAVAEGRDLLDEATQDGIAAAWLGWAETASDVGIQTRQVFAGTAAPTAVEMRRSSQEVHDRQGRSAGNGSLMRTAPVALAYLDDGREDELERAARAISGLTHAERDTGDGCVLWCLAIRHAIRTGELDVRVGLDRVAPHWAGRVEDAERKQPRDFESNGWVVEALQGAWSAIHHGSTLRDRLERAVRGGRDTDTVAAIAGGLAGAAAGSDAIPAEWRRILHGWPGIDADELERLTRATLAAH